MYDSIFKSTNKHRWIPTFLLFFLAWLLTGCASLFDPESSQEFNSHQVGIVNKENNFGQMITSRHALVNGITVWLSQPNSNATSTPGHLDVSVFENTTSSDPIFSTRISTASITQYSSVLISLGTLSTPETGSIYIEFSSTDSEIIVHGRLEDNYSGGQAYHNREPIDADLAFRLTYSYDWNELKLDIQALFAYQKPFTLICLLLFLPGYAVIRLLKLNKIFPLPEQLALAIGLSLAIIPIIYLFASTIGISIISSAIKITGLIFTLTIILTLFIDHSYPPYSYRIKHLKELITKKLDRRFLLEIFTAVGLIGIIFYAFFIRMVMTRDLVTPAWVDSVHHALITRIILNNGTLPATYLPYLDIDSSAYHPGFHSSLATFIKMSGMQIDDGMLIFGQALNAAAAAAVYLLAATLTRKRNTGLIAAIITSTLTAMPAYYTSWGRYPQLAGLLILPVPFALFHATNLSSTKSARRNLLISAALASAGLLLVHYRVAAFLICLFLSWLIVETLFSGKNLRIVIKRYFIHFLSLGGLTFLISAPWIIPMVQETIFPRLVPNQAEATYKLFSDFSWHYLTPLFGKQLIALAAISICWFCLKKEKVALIVSGWILILFFISNLDALNLPGGSLVNNSSVTIMLFMPITVMSGYLIDQLFTVWSLILNRFKRILLPLVISSMLFYLAWLGTRQIISLLNPTTLLSRQADISALHWIDQNIADDEIILINSFAWGYGIYAGSDGGGWISALTGNRTIPPPVLYGLGSAEQIKKINDICAQVSKIVVSPDELWEYLMGQRIEYIYIGARGGAISPAALASNPHYEILYHQSNTWLFHLLP